MLWLRNKKNNFPLHTLTWRHGLKEKLCFSDLFSDILSFRFVDWLQSLKQFFINVPYHILVASLTLMAQSIRFVIVNICWHTASFKIGIS